MSYRDETHAEWWQRTGQGKTSEWPSPLCECGHPKKHHWYEKGDCHFCYCVYFHDQRQYGNMSYKYEITRPDGSKEIMSNADKARDFKERNPGTIIKEIKERHGKEKVTHIQGTGREDD